MHGYWRKSIYLASIEDSLCREEYPVIKWDVPFYIYEREITIKKISVSGK